MAEKLPTASSSLKGTTLKTAIDSLNMAILDKMDEMEEAVIDNGELTDINKMKDSFDKLTDLLEQFNSEISSLDLISGSIATLESFAKNVNTYIEKENSANNVIASGIGSIIKDSLNALTESNNLLKTTINDLTRNNQHNKIFNDYTGFLDDIRGIYGSSINNVSLSDNKNIINNVSLSDNKDIIDFLNTTIDKNKSYWNALLYGIGVIGGLLNNASIINSRVKPSGYFNPNINYNNNNKPDNFNTSGIDTLQNTVTSVISTPTLDLTNLLKLLALIKFSEDNKKDLELFNTIITTLIISLDNLAKSSKTIDEALAAISSLPTFTQHVKTLLQDLFNEDNGINKVITKDIIKQINENDYSKVSETIKTISNILKDLNAINLSLFTIALTLPLGWIGLKALNFEVSIIKTVIDNIKEIDKKELNDTLNTLYNVSKFVAVAAAALIIGGAFFLIPNMAKATLEFGATLLGFVSILTLVISWAAKLSKNNALKFGDELAALTATLTLSMIIGALFIGDDDKKYNAINNFGWLLLKFVGLLSLAIGIGAKFGGNNALKFGNELALLTATLTLSMILGASFIGDDNKKINAIEKFGDLLLKYVIVLSLVIGGAAWLSHNNALKFGNELAVLTATLTLSMIIGAWFIGDNNEKYNAIWKFGLVLTLFIAGLAIAIGLASKLSDGKALKTTSAIITLTVAMTGMLILGPYLINEYLNNDYGRIWAFTGSLIAFTALMGLIIVGLSRLTGNIWKALLALTGITLITAGFVAITWFWNETCSNLPIGVFIGWLITMIVGVAIIGLMCNLLGNSIGAIAKGVVALALVGALVAGLVAVTWFWNETCADIPIGIFIAWLTSMVIAVGLLTIITVIAGAVIGLVGPGLLGMLGISAIVAVLVAVTWFWNSTCADIPIDVFVAWLKSMVIGVGALVLIAALCGLAAPFVLIGSIGIGIMLLIITALIGITWLWKKAVSDVNMEAFNLWLDASIESLKKINEMLAVIGSGGISEALKKIVGTFFAFVSEVLIISLIGITKLWQENASSVDSVRFKQWATNVTDAMLALNALINTIGSGGIKGILKKLVGSGFASNYEGVILDLAKMIKSWKKVNTSTTDSTAFKNWANAMRDVITSIDMLIKMQSNKNYNKNISFTPLINFVNNILPLLKALNNLLKILPNELNSSNIKDKLIALLDSVNEPFMLMLTNDKYKTLFNTSAFSNSMNSSLNNMLRGLSTSSDTMINALSKLSNVSKKLYELLFRFNDDLLNYKLSLNNLSNSYNAIKYLMSDLFLNDITFDTVELFIGYSNQYVKLLDLILTIQKEAGSPDNFERHQKVMDQFVSTVNRLDPEKMNTMNEMIKNLKALGEKFGDIDKLTEAIAVNLTSVLLNLINQLNTACSAVDKADAMQEKRIKAFNNAKRQLEQLLRMPITLRAPGELDVTIDGGASIYGEGDTNDQSQMYADNVNRWNGLIEVIRSAMLPIIK